MVYIRTQAIYPDKPLEFGAGSGRYTPRFTYRITVSELCRYGHETFPLICAYHETLCNIRLRQSKSYIVKMVDPLSRFNLMIMRNDSVQWVGKRRSEVQREVIASLLNPMRNQVGSGLGGQISMAGSTLI